MYPPETWDILEFKPSRFITGVNLARGDERYFFDVYDAAALYYDQSVEGALAAAALEEGEKACVAFNKGVVNTAILLEAKAHILAHPETLDMRLWTCNTAACIGGWVVQLAGEYAGIKHACDYGHIANVVIGTPKAQSLWFVHNWHYKPRQMYMDATSKEEQASAAALAIDYWIKQHGMA